MAAAMAQVTSLTPVARLASSANGSAVSASSVRRSVVGRPLRAKPVRAVSVRRMPAVVASQDVDSKDLFEGNAALSLAMAALFTSAPVQAAQDVAQVAANSGDDRLGLLLPLLGVALAWVGFNILGPASRQLEKMSEDRALLPFAIGASALLAAGNADAAEQIAQLAESDNRLGLLLPVLGVAVGWVAFNIAGPALRQLDKMNDDKKAFLPFALGAGALLAAGNADAAQLVSQVAETDNRLGVLLPVLGVAVAWVGFNIAGPALRQLDKMNDDKKAFLPFALGAGSLLAAGNADAAQLVSQVAEADNRLGVLLPVLGVAIAWVGFNIAGPALRQLDKMNETKAILPFALGAGALFAAENAQAAQQVAQLAESDNRLGVLLPVLGVAIAWVGFNIAGPALRQLDKMNEEK